MNHAVHSRADATSSAGGVVFIGDDDCQSRGGVRVDRCAVPCQFLGVLDWVCGGRG